MIKKIDKLPTQFVDFGGDVGIWTLAPAKPTYRISNPDPSTTWVHLRIFQDSIPRFGQSLIDVFALHDFFILRFFELRTRFFDFFFFVLLKENFLSSVLLIVRRKYYKAKKGVCQYGKNKNFKKSYFLNI